jgi:hypothetical protein
MALDAEIAKVGRHVFLRSGFLAEGMVRLMNAKIGGDLDCSGGKFQNPKQAKIPGAGLALDARGIEIDGSMFMQDEFNAAGTVTLVNARITSSLRYSKATFEILDLKDAFAGSILDEENSWPRSGNLILDGFVYGRISRGPLEPQKRLEWLKRQTSFTRQPYRQLAIILGNTGDDLGVRQILSALQRRAWEQRDWRVRPISHLLRFTIGYGYFPLRAVWLLLALVLVGVFVYRVGYDTGSIVPTDKDSYSYFETNCAPPKGYERFYTIPYSVEHSFPLVKLGVQDKWVPARETRMPACSSGGLSLPVQVIGAPGFVRWFRWIQICIGWLLTTLFVGGVTGILRKN